MGWSYMLVMTRLPGRLQPSSLVIYVVAKFSKNILSRFRRSSMEWQTLSGMYDLAFFFFLLLIVFLRI